MNNILANGANVQIVCNLNDLRKIFSDCLDKQREIELKQKEQQEKGKYLTVVETCKLLDVTKPTLWRWQKLNYLVPVKVGRKNFYRLSDIQALREG